MPTTKGPDGLYERRDSPYYWASYTDADGKRARRSTGIKSTSGRRKEAEALLAKWKSDAYQQQQWGVEPPRTFEEIMLHYLEARRDIASYDTTRIHVQQLQRTFAGVDIRQLRGADIASHIERRRAAGSALVEMTDAVLSTICPHHKVQ